jgi:CubicO group peptidase (beta-lactamase class C family)
LYNERLATPLGFERTRYGHLGISENPGVAGNLITTASEFANFLEMMLSKGNFEGRPLLSADTIATMEEGQTRGKPRRGHVPTRHLGTRHDLYGLGVWRDAVDGRGQLIMSSAPGKFGFTPWIDRRQNILGVFALEVDSEQPDQAIPEPANLQYLVCDILDRAERRPIIRTDVNPACKKGRRVGVRVPKQ